jgi:hypothetical protein
MAGTKNAPVLSFGNHRFHIRHPTFVSPGFETVRHCAVFWAVLLVRPSTDDFKIHFNNIPTCIPCSSKLPPLSGVPVQTSQYSPCCAIMLKLKLKLKLKLYYDRQSVGQSVLVSGAHLGPTTNFSLSLKFSLHSCGFVIL